MIYCIVPLALQPSKPVELAELSIASSLAPVSIVAAIRDASILLHDCRDASIPTARLCHQLCQHCAMLVRLLLWLSAPAHAIAVCGRHGEVVGARGRIGSLLLRAGGGSLAATPRGVAVARAEDGAASAGVSRTATAEETTTSGALFSALT